MSNEPVKEQKVFVADLASCVIEERVNKLIQIGWEVKQIASGQRVVILLERNKS